MGDSANDPYPARFAVDYRHDLARLTTAARDDRLPREDPTDEQQAVRLDVPYRGAHHELNLRLPVVTWLVAIRHYVALVFLYVRALNAAVGVWFANCVTDCFPRGVFGSVEGVIPWHNRVVGYALVLAIDDYSPFPLGP